ncbi:fatty-acyl-CoA synthase [Plasticicumulans lactativorans]|uniref:Fatty-acyl-CoA synthase n=1 Tax=Plasticicumulans lactativorans TaxID=1133106 RepID=A0A4R2L503_9GAMM|nr:fatty acid--CoA ligase [Plasticicumulans lactativorans]TCO80862.1 fatty-acyl-CoA synthase [Plasticicumulans lactativorans]
MNVPAIPRAAGANPGALLIRQLLEVPLAQFPEREIVYAGHTRLDYRRFGERVARLGSALTRLGVRAGQTVAVLDWDSHRYLECFFAVPMLGAVLHTVNIRLAPEQILYTINHAEDDVILVHADFVPLVEGIRARIERPVQLVLLADAAGAAAPAGGAGEYEALLAAADPAFAFPDDLPEDARATTFYTTGTTGQPKGVYFSHRQLVLHTLAERAAVLGTGQGHVGQNDVYMPITPMFHVHAWGFPYTATTLGMKQVYPGRYLPEVLLRLIATEGVTFSHCVPTILHLLLTHPLAAGTDLSGWKVVIGGGALPQALARAALARGIDVFGGYGMSETCPLLTLAQLEAPMLERPFEQQLALRCKAGRAIPLVELRVVDPELRDVAHDGASQGEVVVRAPWLTQGYWRDAAAGAALWAGGWLHTGDIGTLDAEGYLKITDRVKDVIKTGGEWISSLALEDLLLRHPAVAEAAVIALPDERWGERPFALVVPKAGQELDPAALHALLADCAAQGLISKYGVPERIEVVEALPKTSVGKLDKKAMRAHWTP